MAAIKCCSCTAEIKRSDKNVVSCLLCDLKFHSKCVNLSDDLCKTVHENKQIKYVCHHCNNTNLIHEIKDLKNMIQECIETIKDQNKVIQDHSKIIAKLRNEESREEMKDDSRKTYRDVLKRTNKEIIMIKPMNDQESSVTQDEIKEKINPSQLGAAVENIRNLKKGGVLISCKNAVSKDKIQKKVEEELGNKYRVENPQLKNPKIIIIGAENKFANQEDNKIIEDIIEQNDLEKIGEDMPKKIKVVKKYENKRKRNCSNIILEVENDVFKSVYSSNMLNVGWRECRIEEYHNIIRCYKCAGYNHFGRECKNTVICCKCSGNHSKTECESLYEKCINCVKTMERLKIKLDVNHRADDKNCPCYLKMVEKDCNKINYNA